MSVTNSSERSYAPSHIIAAIILCLLLATSVWAQALGNITGTVEDSTGAVIPGATVVITNEETGIVTRVQSRADGTYLAMNLVPGQYRISVESPGFKRFEIRGLRLNVGTTLTQSIVLGIGVVTETIEVSGQTLMVQTTSGEVGSTVQVEQILEMPMPNRNVFSLVNLVPGAWYRGGADDEPRISLGTAARSRSRPCWTAPRTAGAGTASCLATPMIGIRSRCPGPASTQSTRRGTRHPSASRMASRREPWTTFPRRSCCPP